MSTAAPPRPELDRVTGTPEPVAAEPSRFAQWRSSWAVALRMARRDVRRHTGRSALVVVMVLLPTLLLSTVVTIAYTSDVTGAEKIPATMGTGQAFIDPPDSGRVLQGADPSQAGGSGPEDARAIPGYDRDASLFDNAPAVSRLVGADVVPLQRFAIRTTVDDRRVSLDGLALDGTVGLGDKLRLVSGRWPAAPSGDASAPVEALVTPVGIARGLPERGTVRVTSEGTERTLAVVGVAEAQDGWSVPGVVTAGLLQADGPAVTGNGGWIVLGNDPVTWPEVRDLNTYGLRVASADVLANPPSPDQVPREIAEMTSGDDARTGLMVGLAAVMLLVSTTLLVGPAFAVSATRQRRTLALAASNGAHTPVLRRTVLAQALVLGAGSAVLGVTLGVGLARLLVLWDSTTQYPSFGGPFDVRLPVLLAVAACAIASTLVAALIPARRLGRLDIVGVMRGQSVSPRPSVLVFALGALLTAAGSVLTLGGTGVVDARSVLPMFSSDSGEMLVVVGAVVLIVGSLLLVPVLLAGLGRLGGRLPTSLRMAARDIARHRARSAPSVAAVLAVVAGLTFGLTGLASDTEQNRREYVPSTLPGEVLVSGGFGEGAIRADDVAAAPGLTVAPDPVFAFDPARYAETPPQEAYRVPFLSLVPEGCTPEQTLGWGMFQESPQERCTVAGTESTGTGEVPVLPADEIVRRLGLDPAAAAKVRAGAAVVRGLPVDTVRVVRGTYATDPTATDSTQAPDPDVRLVQDVEVPVVRVPPTGEGFAGVLGATVVFAADTTTSQGWPTINRTFTVRDPSGAAVSDTAVEQLQQRLGDEVGVQREDGFQREDRVVVAILLAVFGVLILVVTLTSTALTLAEQQTDQATLAALGATRGTRRVMAAGQAFVLTAVGCVLGVAVGLVPGIAIARPLTSQGYDPLTGGSVEGTGLLVVPWLSLLVVGLLVPVVAAGLAAAGIRRAPQVTRRAT
ncbi:FtsX-like permease family protein [Phycicoccus avicenniae]|uniref:ABC transporter permease n=1 Tax=Phycicoccus avicenniae TaxID=2828860 RepID=UPI003D292CEE